MPASSEAGVSRDISHFGTSLAWGDFDGDGFGDLAIGAHDGPGDGHECEELGGLQFGQLHGRGFYRSIWGITLTIAVGGLRCGRSRRGQLREDLSSAGPLAQAGSARGR